MIHVETVERVSTKQRLWQYFVYSKGDPESLASDRKAIALLSAYAEDCARIYAQFRELVETLPNSKDRWDEDFEKAMLQQESNLKDKFSEEGHSITFTIELPC